MVDTYLPFFDVERELADPKLEKIPETLAVITAAINNREEYILPVTSQAETARDQQSLVLKRSYSRLTHA